MPQLTNSPQRLSKRKQSVCRDVKAGRPSRAALQTSINKIFSTTRSMYYHSLSQTFEPALSSRPSSSPSVTFPESICGSVEPDKIHSVIPIAYTEVCGIIYFFFIFLDLFCYVILFDYLLTIYDVKTRLCALYATTTEVINRSVGWSSLLCLNCVDTRLCIVFVKD